MTELNASPQYIQQIKGEIREDNYKNIVDRYSSKIKDVFLELNDYQFIHSPFAERIENNWFIGRNRVLSRLKIILNNSSTRSGAYLITGFRGMGKTSIVRKAIKEVNESGSHGGLKKLLDNIIRFKWKDLWFVTVRTFFIAILPLVVMLLLGLFWKDRDVYSFNIWQPEDYSNLFLYSFRHLWTSELAWTLKGVENLFSILLPSFICVWAVTSAMAVLIMEIRQFFLFNLGPSTPKFKHFEINLPQDDVKDYDVLIAIAKDLLIYWKELKERDFLYRSGLWGRVVRFLIWPHRFLLFSSHRRPNNYEGILQELLILNKRISAKVSQMQSISVDAGLSTLLGENLGSKWLSKLGWQRRDEMTYPLAGSKEVESDLIRILKNIERWRTKVQKSEKRRQAFYPLSYRPSIPEFIFIIDELDKIEPNYNYSTPDAEASDPKFDDSRGVYASEKIRQRQEAIARLLANLKSFLNVAMAKFIFIGGREMYDASLADIADRDSFYSSIFHDIIYVNSFFKDKIEARSGVTRMTEAYLMQFLLPDGHFETRGIQEANRLKNCTLREYYLFLLSYYNKKYYLEMPAEILNGAAYADLARYEKYQLQEKIFKIVFLLQNLIIFLTYRSNGTPKKLSGLIEDYIVSGRGKVASNWDNRFLVVHNPYNSKKDNRLYLRFSFNRQYEIGLTSNLYRPYIIIHSRYLKAMGDKLLFSNAFMMDHILKFHPFGFSWRNLELIPEIILFNKEPNLRAFIKDLIQFLSSTYIRPTVSGLYQFRFYNKIVNELKYISKISDLSAAAFNFTLDESLLIKRHYKKKLEELQGRYQSFTPTGKENRYVHSIGFLQTILGDLHHYDKEFDDALLYYADAAQTLRIPVNPKSITRHQVVLYIRNQLRAALVLTKVRAYESAFAIYRGLQLDMPRFMQKLIDREKENQSDDLPSDITQLLPFRGLQLINKPFVAWLELLEKMRSEGVSKDNLQQSLHDYLIGILEEQTKSGILIRDQYRCAALRSGYLNNVGSILFYKNRHLGVLTKNGHTTQWDLAPSPLLMPGKDDDPVPPGAEDYHPSVTSYFYYLHALNEFHLGIREDACRCGDDRVQSALDNIHHPLLRGISIIKERRTFKANTFFWYNSANLLSKIGDAMLASLHFESYGTLTKEVIDLYACNDQMEKNKVLNGLLKWLDRRIGRRNLGEEVESDLDLNFVLVIYRLAGLYYRQGNRMYSYAFQFKKCLYLIRDYMELTGKRLFKAESKMIDYLDNNYLESLREDPFFHNAGQPSSEIFNQLERLASNVFVSITQAGNVANRPQILKARFIFGNDFDRDLDRDFIYNNITTSPDTKEVVLLIEDIKLKWTRLLSNLLDEEKTSVIDPPTTDFKNNLSRGEALLVKVFGLPKQENSEESSILRELDLAKENIRGILKDRQSEFAFCYDLLSPYSGIANKSVRMQELRFRCEKNYYFLVDRLHLKDLLDYDLKLEPRDSMITQVIRHELEQIKAAKSEVMQEARVAILGDNATEVNFSRIVEFLICDSIFCLYDIAKTIDIYGKSYMMSHSYLASIHYRLANWCRAYSNLFYLDRTLQMNLGEWARNELGRLVGSDALYYLEPNYHNELGIKHLYLAMQMHQEGRLYKNYLHDLYFLEDDFNDNLYHFCAANERFRMNVGLLRIKVEELKDKVSESRLFEYNSYRKGEYNRYKEE